MNHDVHRMNTDVTVHMVPRFTRLGAPSDAPRAVRALKQVVYGIPANTTWVMAASDSSMNGFQTIEEPKFGGCIEADGTRLKLQGSAAIIQVADCAVVIVFNRHTKEVLVFHAGRNALDGSQGPYPDCGSNIASMALTQFMGEQPGEQFEVFVGAHICGDCFDHSHADAEQYVSWFRGHYGEDVFADWARGCLSLRAVLAEHFKNTGIPETNITWDDNHRCTLEDEGLSSHRRGNAHRNTFVIIKH